MLPGGILREGELRRGFRFRELDGEMELALAESDEAGEALPRRVSRVLAAALEHVGGERASVEVVEELCVADRQFLMQRLDRLLGNEATWLTTRCARCQEPFDFPLRWSELPVKEAGAGFPRGAVETGQGRVGVRVPNGGDQVAQVSMAREPEGVRALLVRCLLAGDAPVDPARLTREELVRIEEEMERLSPAVVTCVQASCPACGALGEVEVNPYRCLSRASAVMEEVHILASAYHWSEREILALPLRRRRKYLRLVERDECLAS
jgi:hypothetical protein